MTTNQDIIDAAKRLSDYTKDARGRESFDFDNYSLAEFSALITQPLRQELAETQAQLKEAREALGVLYEENAQYILVNKLGNALHNRSMQMANKILLQSPSYSALDAAIEPYRLDAERYRLLRTATNDDGLIETFNEICPNPETPEQFDQTIDAAIARKG